MAEEANQKLTPSIQFLTSPSVRLRTARVDLAEKVPFCTDNGLSPLSGTLSAWLECWANRQPRVRNLAAWCS
jgi:hypothetical protein